MSFNGKVVLVTGSSSGIGEATVLLFAQKGATVVVQGRDKVRVAQVVEKCKSYSVPAIGIVADLSVEKEVDKVIADVISAYGRLDVLVNNAGYGGDSDCESENALVEFDKQIAVNLRAPFQLCWRAFPHLKASKGSVVNVSSICGLKPYIHTVSYCTAKAGLDMLTRSLAVKWGPHGIRVNCVNPAQIDTPIFRRGAKLNEEQLESMWNDVRKSYPLRREGKPEDIGRAIVYFASDDSDWITGVSLKVDGGFLDSPQLSWGGSKVFQ